MSIEVKTYYYESVGDYTKPIGEEVPTKQRCNCQVDIEYVVNVTAFQYYKYRIYLFFKSLWKLIRIK